MMTIASNVSRSPPQVWSPGITQVTFPYSHNPWAMATTRNPWHGHHPKQVQSLTGYQSVAWYSPNTGTTR